METKEQQNRQRRSDEIGSDDGSALFSDKGLQGSFPLEEIRLSYARQLHRWGSMGGRSLQVELIQMPDAENGGTALVRAEVVGIAGQFLGYGSADSRLIGSSDPGRLLECAELLAKQDALSQALKMTQPASGDLVSASPTRPVAGDPVDTSPVARQQQRSRPFSPFTIPPDMVARQRIDLARPPQGEGAKIYQYFHQLIGQMKQQSRQLKEMDQGLVDQMADQKNDVSFYTYPQALLMVSHAIEDEFVQRQLVQPFYVGVQYFSRLRPQEPRYRTIQRLAQRLMIFGLADMPLWSDLRLESVALDLHLGTGLERFWWVVTKGPDWNTALLAEHLAGDFTRPLAKRQYQGFWTFDPVIVERIVGTLDYARSLMPGTR